MDFDPQTAVSADTGDDFAANMGPNGVPRITVTGQKSSAPDFDPSTAKPTDPKTGGILPNFGAGFVEGVTGGFRLLENALNPYPDVRALINYTRGDKDTLPKPVTDQAWWNKLAGHIGFNPDDVAADTIPERIARYAGQGSTAVLFPEGGAPGLIARGVTAGGRALTGAVAGVAGGAANEALPAGTPDLIRWPVSLLASMAAGIPFSLATSAIGSIPGAASRISELPRASVSGGAAENLAGRVLAENTSDAQSVKDMLSTPAQPIVPGSAPTTFQATGDMGLGALERAVATKHPELFKQREAEQNAARVEAMGGIQQGADPVAVADYFRKQLADADQRTAADIETKVNAARAATASIGGEVPPEAIGNTVRDAVATAEAAARQSERGLWKAVDPEGNLTGNVTATSAAAERIAKAMRTTEAPMTGEELASFNAAKGLPDVAPVADLIALRSRVSTAMRDELMSNGSSPSYRRLTMLRGAIQDNLAKTISERSVVDQAAVDAGKMAPEAAITARIAAWRQKLEAERDQFLRDRTAAGIGGTGGTGGTGGPAGAGAIETSGAGGTGLPPNGGPGSPAGATGLPGNAPTFDQAAGGRLAAATQATKERAQTFGLGPVGQILRSQGTQGAYRLADAGVPAKFFHPGPAGFQDVQSLAAAVGPERAAALTADAAAASLRRAAMTEEGLIDPRRYAVWAQRHADALRALPQPVRDAFSSARDASQAVAEAQAARQNILKTTQVGKAAQLLGAQSAEDVSRVVGQVFASPQGTAIMQGLVKAVASDPGAKAGLRQAVADYIAKRFLSNKEVATSGVSGIKEDAFQSFVKNNRAALSHVFKPGEVDTLFAISDDLRQAARSQNAIRLKAQSNTAQDVAAMAKQTSLLQKIFSDFAGAGAGLVMGGPVGAMIGGLGAHSMTALRDAGIQRVDDLVARAMLDPALAKRLLERVPPAKLPSTDRALARAIRRSFYGALPTSANAKAAN